MDSGGSSIRVIDGGSRYGLHPTWEDLQHISTFLLFEPDTEEAERLSRTYRERPNITVVQAALGSTNGAVTLHRAEHHGLTSGFLPNYALLEQHNHKVKEFAAETSFESQAVTIDSLNWSPDFLKLDIEGNELAALLGAEDALTASLLGIRAEVQFHEIWLGAPFFGDIDLHLRQRGFRLLNIDYEGKGVAQTQFADPNRYGTLMYSDAVWLASSQLLAKRAEIVGAHDGALSMTKMALFCMNNFAGDVGMSFAEEVRSIIGAPIPVREDPLFSQLEFEVAQHLKGASYVPSVSQAAIDETYGHLFGSDFPSAHRFYQRPKNLLRPS